MLACGETHRLKEIMPNEVKAYSCAWGCARNVITSKSRMIVHEGMCNWNPDMKACITCGNFTKSTGRGEDFESSSCEAGYDVRVKLRNKCDRWISKPAKTNLISP